MLCCLLFSLSSSSIFYVFCLLLLSVVVPQLVVPPLLLPPLLCHHPDCSSIMFLISNSTFHQCNTPISSRGGSIIICVCGSLIAILSISSTILSIIVAPTWPLNVSSGSGSSLLSSCDSSSSSNRDRAHLLVAYCLLLVATVASVSNVVLVLTTMTVVFVDANATTA